MKNMLAAVACTTLFTSLSQIALAEDTHGKRYAAVDVGFYTVENEESDADADITHLTGRVGGYINDNLALEARLGTGVTDDTVQGTDVSLRYLVGANLRAGVKVNQLFPYVMLGFTRADIETENNGNSESNAETDTSYGAGLDLDLSGMTVTMEYANLIDKNEVTYSGFSIGLKTTF
jgi:hypothetical protein